jgi:hypothetical protein
MHRPTALPSGSVRSVNIFAAPGGWSPVVELAAGVVPALDADERSALSPWVEIGPAIDSTCRVVRERRRRWPLLATSIHVLIE